MFQGKISVCASLVCTFCNTRTAVVRVDGVLPVVLPVVSPSPLSYQSLPEYLRLSFELDHVTIWRLASYHESLRIGKETVLMSSFILRINRDRVPKSVYPIPVPASE